MHLCTEDFSVYLNCKQNLKNYKRKIFYIMSSSTKWDLIFNCNRTSLKYMICFKIFWNERCHVSSVFYIQKEKERMVYLATSQTMIKNKNNIHFLQIQKKLSKPNSPLTANLSIPYYPLKTNLSKPNYPLTTTCLNRIHH